MKYEYTALVRVHSNSNTCCSCWSPCWEDKLRMLESDLLSHIHYNFNFYLRIVRCCLRSGRLAKLLLAMITLFPKKKFPKINICNRTLAQLVRNCIHLWSQLGSRSEAYSKSKVWLSNNEIHYDTTQRQYLFFIWRSPRLFPPLWGVAAWYGTTAYSASHSTQHFVIFVFGFGAKFKLLLCYLIFKFLYCFSVANQINHKTIRNECGESPQSTVFSQRNQK